MLKEANCSISYRIGECLKDEKDGNRKYTGDYREGKRDGKWIAWNEKGNEIINGIYRNDWDKNKGMSVRCIQD